jgi:serine protease Do
MSECWRPQRRRTRADMRALLTSSLIATLAVLGPAPAGADRESRRTPIVRAVERVAPATVNITSLQVVREASPFASSGNPLFDEFWDRFFDPRPRNSQSLGTGVIIDAAGHVLTNEHVLAGATQTRVTLADGREFDGEIVGLDPDNDLGVLRLMTEDPLPIAPLGDSESLMIGETVIAIGNPFGLNHTVTTGVLSATHRSIRGRRSARGNARDFHGFLQTDASINPGNSGGPLVNVDGEVIGVNTAILGNAEGIGFAIPITRARRIVEELIEHGEVAPSWLGVLLQDLTPALRGSMGIQAPSGAVVTHVFEGSPAAEAGLRRGDVVLALEGTRVRSRRAYFEILGGLTDGGRARIEVERGGKELTFALVARAFPEDRADSIAKILLGLEVSGLRRLSRGRRAAGAGPRADAGSRCLPQGGH